MYLEKKYFDHYAGNVFKTIKVFFHYLAVEKVLPIGEFYKRFRVPTEYFTPVILSPAQLRYLISNFNFKCSLSASLQRARDTLIFGCTVGLRFRDLMDLQKTNIQYTPEGVQLLLYTRKTGAVVSIPLPDYVLEIISKYKRSAGRYILPRLSNTNLNLQLKTLVRKAGWDYYLPKIRHRRGEPVEIKKNGETYRFYDHITAHTMRRTAITTLLLMGVEESMVRRISGHTAGSKEFYRYVVIVQDYLNASVRKAHAKLLEGGNET